MCIFLVVGFNPFTLEKNQIHTNLIVSPIFAAKKNKSQKTSTPLTYTYLNYLYVSGFIQGTKYIKHVENVCKFLLSSWNLQKKTLPVLTEFSDLFTCPAHEAAWKQTKTSMYNPQKLNEYIFQKWWALETVSPFGNYSYFLEIYIYLNFQEGIVEPFILEKSGSTVAKVQVRPSRNAWNRHQ